MEALEGKILAGDFLPCAHRVAFAFGTFSSSKFCEFPKMELSKNIDLIEHQNPATRKYLYNKLTETPKNDPKSVPAHVIFPMNVRNF